MNTQTQAPATAGRVFVISIIRNGMPMTHMEAYPSHQAAMDFGLDLLGTCRGIVSARPLVEWTENEGARRFPHQLHKNAFADAWRGWHERAQAEFDGAEPSDAEEYRAHCDRALTLQVRMEHVRAVQGALS